MAKLCRTYTSHPLNYVPIQKQSKLSRRKKGRMQWSQRYSTQNGMKEKESKREQEREWWREFEVEKKKEKNTHFCLLRLHIIRFLQAYQSLSLAISIVPFYTKAPHFFPLSASRWLTFSLSICLIFLFVSMPIHRFVIFKQGSHFKIRYVYLSSKSRSCGSSSIQLCSMPKRFY